MTVNVSEPSQSPEAMVAVYLKPHPPIDCEIPLISTTGSEERIASPTASPPTTSIASTRNAVCMPSESASTVIFVSVRFVVQSNPHVSLTATFVPEPVEGKLNCKEISPPTTATLLM